MFGMLMEDSQKLKFDQTSTHSGGGHGQKMVVGSQVTGLWAISMIFRVGMFKNGHGLLL